MSPPKDRWREGCRLPECSAMHPERLLQNDAALVPAGERRHAWINSFGCFDLETPAPFPSPLGVALRKREHGEAQAVRGEFRNLNDYARLCRTWRSDRKYF